MLREYVSSEQSSSGGVAQPASIITRAVSIGLALIAGLWLGAGSAKAETAGIWPTVYVPVEAPITPAGGHTCAHVAAELPKQVARQLARRSIPVVRDPKAPHDVVIELSAQFEIGRRDDDARMRTSTAQGVLRDAQTSVSTMDDCRSFATVAAQKFVDDLVSTAAWRSLVRARREPAAPVVPRAPPNEAPPAPPVVTAAPSLPSAETKGPAKSSGKRLKVAAQVQAIFQDKCLHCHGGENGQAEKDVYILDHPRLVETRVLRPKDLESPLWSVIKSGEMPEDDDLTESEKGTIRRWIEAGAPDWATERRVEARTFVGEPVILAAIRDDLVEVRERDRKWTRYFSIAHLYNAGLPDGALESYRVGLSLLLNSLSWRRKVSEPTALGPSGLLLRIDLRDYQWKDGTWEKILEHDNSGLPWAFDIAEEIKALSGSSVPYVRADWFVAKASVPPLYHVILDLPKTVGALERRLQVDVRTNLNRKRDVIRAGVRKSGVSRHNRVVERHVSAFGVYWKSFDFSSSAGRKNIFSNPVKLHEDGGEMVFSLPNGMQAYFIVDARGRRIDRAPVSIVFDRDNADGPEVVNGRSCMRCHFNGVRQLTDDIRPMLGKMTAARSWLDEARDLFPGQSVLNEALEEDRDRYRRAVQAAGGTVARTKDREPIYRLARRFESELSLAQAAAEVGLTPDLLQPVIAGSPKLQKDGFAQLLVDGASIKRDAWEKSRPLVILATLPCEILAQVEEALRAKAARFGAIRLRDDGPNVGRCMMTRAEGYERSHPKLAESSYEEIIASHPEEPCGGEVEFTCGSAAKARLADLRCRSNASGPRGGATQGETRTKLMAALRAKDTRTLTKLAACTVWVGTMASDNGSDQPAAEAVSYVLELMSKGEWRFEVVADGLRLVGKSDIYLLSLRRTERRWLWSTVELDVFPRE